MQHPSDARTAAECRLGRPSWAGAGPLATVLAVLLALPVRAQDSGRLLATSGVSQLKGSAGGGLVPWAVITGYGTRDSVGANAHDTLAYLPSFTLHSAGASIGIHGRGELSYAHQWCRPRRAGDDASEVQRLRGRHPGRHLHRPLPHPPKDGHAGGGALTPVP